MKEIARILVVGSVLASSLLIVGCSGNDMTKAELDSLKNSPKMTDADRAKVIAGMAKGATDARSQEAEWAKQHPDKVASVNAARAQRGLPPLGK